jgi:hypothetical protein
MHTDHSIAASDPPRLLRGIEAGIVGGFTMLALLILGSLLRGRVWWEVPNVLGSTFYGSRAFRSGVSMATLSGIALHFVITGCIGGIFGLACGGIRERKRLVLVGILAGVVWYYLGLAVFWSRINPWVPVFSSQPIAIIAHALFGACLGRMGYKLEQPEPIAPSSAPDAVE